MIHYKTGSTDGVSLEMEKWRQVIEESGHTVSFCSGLHEGEDAEYVSVIPELFYHTPEAGRLNEAMFSSLDVYDEMDKEAAFEKDLETQSRILEGKLSRWIAEHGIEVLIPENIWSVALHPAAALALERVASVHHLKVVCHHHDFYWERLGSLKLTCARAMELAETVYPPHAESYHHVVINSLAQKSLLHRKGIRAEVIPNVFDFTPESHTEFFPDEFNSRFRKDAGVGESDIMILQATRIVPRKGIEMAIDAVARMNEVLPAFLGKKLYDGRDITEETRIVLVLAGYSEDDRTGIYLDSLIMYAKRNGVRLIHAGSLVSSHREESPMRRYSLWDTYAHADLVSYPSYWEGWGNQLLEAMRARLPIILFEYPVYTEDIADKGLEALSLGNSCKTDKLSGFMKSDEEILKETARKTLEILTNRKKYENMVERNFSIGNEYFSLMSLQRYLKPYMEEWD